ncbi:hypothetical protein GCM10011247_23680 [Pseudomonas plecoglossicida]|nr:hypothetical protein GCM10011247_23680 [Pseudomonas plecoglossicida]
MGFDADRRCLHANLGATVDEGKGHGHSVVTEEGAASCGLGKHSEQDNQARKKSASWFFRPGLFPAFSQILAKNGSNNFAQRRFMT